MEFTAPQGDIEIIKKRKTTIAIQFYTDETFSTEEDMSGYTLPQAEARETQEEDSALICTFDVDDSQKATGLYVLKFIDNGTITQEVGFQGFWDMSAKDTDGEFVPLYFGYAEVVAFPTKEV